MPDNAVSRVVRNKGDLALSILPPAISGVTRSSPLAIVMGYYIKFDRYVNLFDAKEELVDEREGDTAFVRASRAADAVDVIFQCFRQVIVNDVGNIGNIQSAARDIGCE